MSTEQEEQKIIETAWTDFGAKGAAAAAIALVVIYDSKGFEAAAWALVAALSGVVIWILIMKLLVTMRGKSLFH